MSMYTDVKCDPTALRELLNGLIRTRAATANALESLKAAYEGAEWEDRMAFITEQILNAHITAMNGELTRLGRMIRTLELMLEETDYYTSSAATAVTR